MNMKNDADMREHFIERNEVFNGRVLKISVDKVTLPNGRPATRELVRHPGAAVILPVTQEGLVVFVRQYRYAVDEVLYELPAGKLDKGESPENCARRELTEETGYAAQNMEKLLSIFTVPGFCDEVIHIYKATGLHLKKQSLDEDEFLKVCLLDPAEVKRMLKAGIICDAKTLCALFVSGITNE